MAVLFVFISIISVASDDGGHLTRNPREEEDRIWPSGARGVFTGRRCKLILCFYPSFDLEVPLLHPE
jgi:hypothetical protein